MPQLFIGTWPPAEVESVLTDYPQQQITGVRWATPQQWLVTMREVGDVSAATVAEIAAALGAALGGMGTAQATLGAVQRDGGLQIDVEGLEAQTAAVFEATTPIVSATPSADRYARIVVARGRLPKELAKPVPAVAWTVTELAVATAVGPAYETVETIPLGP